MKLYLGCGPGPLHEQHRQVMENPDEWTFVDLFVKEPNIKNWDCATLEEVDDNSVENIYSSHLLEHFPHVQIRDILSTWNRKLQSGGNITLNVPDLVWAAKQLIRMDNGQPLDGYYYQFEGEHGLLSIFYGSESHDGEYHKAGFTKEYFEKVLKETGYSDIVVEKKFDAHDMGVLIATARKA